MNTFATKVKPIGKPTTTAQSPAPADTNNPLDSTAKSTTSTKAGVPINVKPIRKPTSTKSSTTSTRTTPSVNQSQRPTRKPITTPGNPPNNNQPPAASSAGLTGPASGAVSAPSAGPGPASSNQNNPPPAISTPVTSTTSTNSRPPPPPPPPPPASTPSTSSSGQASPADIQNALNAHNAARAKHGEVPLVWDTSLAAAAKAYSEYLAQLGFLKHNSTGENLYSYFPVNNRPLLQATNAWVAEEPKYQGEPIPQGPFLSYGHYTQVVWNTTLRVGMGFTINGSHTYVVARYLPVGNILGFTPY
ncbi:PR-1-like protein [Thozetella sp. PMI_491]|nr:PR-1-like protein [Thozetella sp. PMI_491]